ncbi:MAG: C40 family peptidase [Bacteroidia bacterium]
MKKLAYSLILLSCLMSVVACNPTKQARKYDYLTRERDGSSQGNASTPTKTAPRNSRPIKGKMDVQKVVNKAQSYIGTPYKYGGATKRGMDCSGLVCTSYQAINKDLPRTAAQLSESGTKIRRNDLRPGDLVFFNAKGKGPKINHVGLVVSVRGKDVRFIHSTTSRGVREDLLNEGYWSTRFRKAVRV